MKRRNLGWMLYGLGLMLLLVNFFVISVGQYKSFAMFVSPGRMSPKVILNSVLVWGIGIEPLLILISIAGFAVRGLIGYAMAAVFSYFIIAYALLRTFSLAPEYGRTDLLQFLFILIILFILNITLVANKFSYRLKFKQQVLMNVAIFGLGVIINFGLMALK